ncbi:DinB family protein [Halobacillus naozhouensis]|uniref:DinB family protein n=1 Tax=Halobacillus naozhouensis TaxID=554880 RepID=A0ABY8J189_9BACI|nr:DinB family protein [Halobacillus naozhouensis]WFT76274.1 DinB family protein [Halobacillus naozhouensis]
MNVLIEQYNWIRCTREKLFHYCETITPEDYTCELDQFGWGSIRNLHVHVAECYQSWLGNFGLEKGLSLATPDLVSNVGEMRRIFEKVDRLVIEFLEKFEGQWNLGISGSVPWHDEEEELTPLWLYTHAATHEFHHKGQIVAMSRQLGYTPDDTDLIEP